MAQRTNNDNLWYCQWLTEVASKIIKSIANLKIIQVVLAGNIIETDSTADLFYRHAHIGKVTWGTMQSRVQCKFIPRVSNNRNFFLLLKSVLTVNKQKDVTHTFSKMLFFVICVDYHILHLIEISKKFHSNYFPQSEQKLIFEIKL